MALALPLLAGFVLAPLLGGRWSRIGKLRLRLVWLFYVAIAVQLVAFPVKAMPWHTSDRIGIVLWLCSYGLFAAGVAGNFRIPGIPLIAAGLVSNLAAILSNGGHMPALPSALRAAGLHFTHSRNSAQLASPHLGWLVDRWAAPSWVPWANVFSVGDVLIMAGGLLFALGATGALRRRSDELDLLHQRVRWIEEQLQHELTTPSAPESHSAGAEAEVIRVEPVAKQPLRLLERLMLVPTPADDGEGHVCLVATVGGYELHERPGVAPMANTLVDLGEGLWGEVVKVGRSPLPNDKRRCAYLLQPVSAATGEEEMPGLALVSSG